MASSNSIETLLPSTRKALAAQVGDVSHASVAAMTSPGLCVIGIFLVWKNSGSPNARPLSNGDWLQILREAFEELDALESRQRDACPAYQIDRARSASLRKG